MEWKNVFCVLAVLVNQSCTFIRMDDSVDLGNNYRFIQDAPKTIIYHSTKKYEGVGIEIIPPIVLSYNFDEQYIIAKSQDVDYTTGNRNEKLIKYWIIDKKMKGKSIEPLDSIDFNRMVELLNIKVSLNSGSRRKM